ncbi:hypothetical protein [Xanthomonas citri]|uniref:hypothetical protein n=1 Tax=Xanthomonas citri TaxID=346 RepID=UPI00053796E8|nr:hypothetical protein [Xanthomonas citri]KGU40736.1 hypothetical protein NY95_15045 [Xanthomonas citri pv. fuscans]
MANPSFAKRTYKLQNAIVRELNNAHIFLEQTVPVLDDAKSAYGRSKSKKDKRYYVPSTKKGKFAKRTDVELKTIYDQYLNSGLYESFLVSLVARFEWFLADVLTDFLSHYPLRITEKFNGVLSAEKIEVRVLLESADKNDLVRRVISGHVSNVFRQRPSIYMAYISGMIGTKEDPCFTDFFEISATRDLVVHNSRVANEIYLTKSRDKARATIGDQVAVDDRYFAHCIAAMKRVSGALKRDIEVKYGGKAQKV